MAAAGIKDVAARAGVSIGTVSNVLNRPHIVAAATRQRVQQAIAELKFVRSDAAHALRAGRTRTIGLIVEDVTNPFFTDIAEGAEAVADDHGVLVTIRHSARDAARQAQHLKDFEEQRLRGVLITALDACSGEARTSELRRFRDRGTPVVLLDDADGWHDGCCVGVDDVLAGRLAGEHLVQLGHQRLAFAGDPGTSARLSRRHAGVLRALEAGSTGGQVVLLPTTTLDVEGGEEAAAALRALPVAQRPSAVVCANDLVALGVLRHLRSHGVGVPRDVALVGFDDIAYAAVAAVPLSSVRRPRQEMGRLAAALLLEEIDSPQTHHHRRISVQPTLVARQSSS